MKRFVLALTAASFLVAVGAPAANAADRYGPRFPAQHGQSFDRDGKGFRADGGKSYRKYDDRRFNNHKPRWSKGQRVPAWQRGHVVKDYHRHGLRRPAHGQQWVRVGNDYILIAVASGIIASFLAR